MIRTIEHLLPDMDLALNAMDEPRLVVPWEEMERYMTEAEKTRKLADVKRVVGQYRKLEMPGDGTEADEETPEKDWEQTSL
jgi:hypothetical protein